MGRAMCIRKGGTEHGLVKAGDANRIKSPRRPRKREKVAAGPGPGEYKVGHETNNRGELRARWGGPKNWKGGTEPKRAKAGVANRQWSPEDRERERK